MRIASGYAEEHLRDRIGIAGVPYLPKPYLMQKISDKVGAVLAAAG